MVEPLLRVEQVSRRFGGLLALDRASFAAEPGRITALIGPNGAGKTTLFSIIAGYQSPSTGSIIYDGASIAGEPPYRLARRGIGRTFQIAQPFMGLTVRENIAVGAHLSRPARADALAAAADIAREVGLVLLCHKLRRAFRGRLRAQQCGHRSMVCAIATASQRRIVAIELGTWRSGLIGGAAGSVTTGKGRFFEPPGGTWF
jgi:ABC-type branched-subunit amino acid transport system ATPase component